jgi:dCMP deaminase
MSRPDWTEYFLGVAEAVSRRGDCRRKQVGSVIVNRSNRIIGAGYNGTAPGGPSCLAGQCPRGLLGYDEVAPLSSYEPGTPGFCISIHSEDNALRDARDRARALLAEAGRLIWEDELEDLLDKVTRGATMYTTYEPCAGCMDKIGQAGIVRAVWPEGEWTR